MSYRLALMNKRCRLPVEDTDTRKVSECCRLTNNFSQANQYPL